MLGLTLKIYGEALSTLLQLRFFEEKSFADLTLRSMICNLVHLYATIITSI